MYCIDRQRLRHRHTHRQTRLTDREKEIVRVREIEEGRDCLYLGEIVRVSVSERGREISL